MPGSATYVIDGRSVVVTVTSEAGRVDVNEADRALIERVLSALGASAAQRSDLVQAVVARRAAGQRLTALAQVAGMIEMADGGRPTRACVLDAFTVHSGLALPVAGLNATVLAPIIGTAPLNAPSPPASTPLRLAARTDAGASLVEVVVIGGQGALPAAVTDRWVAGQCDR